MKKFSRIIIPAMKGNALEFYDFTLYGIFAVSIGKLFFPSESATISLLASWGAFAAGFMMRPIGGLFFGYLGDKFGRKYALSWTILLSGAPTLIIGLLPSYETLGIIAPLTLILCRLCQGLCTGGEYNGAAIFALEHIGNVQPGAAGGLITSSVVIGALMATFAGYLVTSFGDEWMWRIPFIAGALISALGFFIRRYMNETPEFENLQKRPQAKKLTLVEIYQTHGRSSTIAFFLGAFNGSLTYSLLGFLNMYMSKYLGWDMVLAMQLNLAGLFIFMILSPAAGYLLDVQGHQMGMRILSIAVFVTIVPVYYLLQSQDIYSIILGQALLGGLAAGIAGSGHIFLQKLFPPEARYRGISVNFCLGMAIFGGTTPMILTYLIESLHLSLYAPALYPMAVSVIFFAVYQLLGKKETHTPETFAYAEQGVSG
ncbi:MFS transporter [Candidatus Bealeia paramacronuclearis]|uniref:MFS transporter n=1 Tax=Candidatus Bealeia paramacronuclearis TaxID=1921001 RepID=A0ABZ2C4A9_9PROT|nr:MFS transporter [Candidatus Bealeia paramacronuclearis]